MKSQEFDTWIAVLRSGQFKQTQGQMKSGGGGFCCLGLLTETVLGFDLSRTVDDDLEHVMFGPGMHQEGMDEWAFASGVADAPRVLRAAIPNERMRDALAILNDRGWSFEEIAKYLEAQRDDYVDDDPFGLERS